MTQLANATVRYTLYKMTQLANATEYGSSYYTDAGRSKTHHSSRPYLSGTREDATLPCKCLFLVTFLSYVTTKFAVGVC